MISIFGDLFLFKMIHQVLFNYQINFTSYIFPLFQLQKISYNFLKNSFQAYYGRSKGVEISLAFFPSELTIKFRISFGFHAA